MSDKRDELAKRRDRLSAEKQTRLDVRLRGGFVQGPAAAPISKRTDAGPAPLTYSQEGLHILERLSPGLPQYNIPLTLRLFGPVNVEALRQSLDDVIGRHEALRTRFSTVDGTARQVVDEPRQGVMRFVDLCDSAEDLRYARAIALAKEAAEQPFDFANGPMLRAVLFRLGEVEHLLSVVVQHIVFDGWSVGIFQRELAGFYNARVNNKAFNIAPLPFQFADYAAWQRSSAGQGEFGDDLAFWHEKLRGPLPELAFLLTPDHSAPVGAGGLAVARVPEDIADTLRAFCRDSQTTVFATLLTVWKTLLYRYSGEEDILSGSAVAGRDRTELEPLIGYFVNTIVLRTSLSGAPTFEEAVQRIRATTVEAFEHQRLPFELLVQDLQPSRVPGRVPLIQTMFVVQNTPSVEAKFGDVEATRIDVHNGTAKFPLTLMVFEDEDGFRLELEHELALVDSVMAQRMLVHFQRLIEDGLEHPHTSISDLAMLTPEEERLLIGEWNATAREYPREKTVSQVFEEQAARAPESVALVFGPDTLTYGELNARANRLARYLTERGARPAAIIAVCMERSSEAIVAILGILKAGCAYLPLDPDYPKKRIEQVLIDARPALIVTNGKHSRDLSDLGLPLVVIDEVMEEARLLSGDNPESSRATGESLAYVIYTSGSTGGPKGVCVPHRAVLRLVLNTDYISIQATNRVAQASNLAFDAATFELWGALLNGGCLVGIPDDIVLSPRELKGFLQREQIDVMWVTAGLFNHIASQEPDAFRTLSTVMAGGEALTPKWVRRVLESGAPGRFLNGYGPTESTTFATWHHVREVSEEATSIPIGKPVANTTAYVLGDHLCLLPLGAPGELCLGGDGLALGYLGDSALTAERFIPNPFAPGEKLYRTGDLVRRSADGAIDFLGRLDCQVKIRGFRVELSEIENAIQSVPGIGNAAVALHETAPEVKELVAYVVPQDGDEVEPDSLREKLRSRLPEYMVPSRYVRIEEIPLNANGKVDRHRLPQPGRDRSEFGGAYVEPVTETERALAAIWSELLGRPQVSRHDNFFDTGGNSLLAIQLQSRIEQRLGIRLAVRDLFEYQQLDEQASILQGKGTGANPEAIPRRKSAGPVPLSFSQEGLFVLEGLFPGLPQYNVPLVLRLRGELDAAALGRSLDAIAARHEVLRSRLVLRDGSLIQVVDEPRNGLLQVVDLSSEPSAARDERAYALALDEAKRPFDFAEGPMLRAFLLRLGDADHVLVVTVHHIVFDGWSVGVFLRELCQGYNVGLEGPSTGAETLPIQFPDYAAWQRASAERGDFEEDLAYWRRKLANPPPELQFLVGPSDSGKPKPEGALVVAHLTEELTGSLRAFCQERHATLYITLLAAWKTLLFRYSGEEDILVGSPTAGRDRVELEPMIGYFVNTVLLRTRLSSDLTFAATVERVGAVSVEALEHHRLPFETLVQELRPNRAADRVPYIQSMFVVQNAPAAAAQFRGIHVERIEIHNGTAKFPLTLMAHEEGDGIRLDLEYETATVDHGVARGILAHFQNLLTDGLAAPEKAIADLAMLTAEEENLLLREWNATQREYPRDASIPQIFEAQAARTPQAVAVVFRGKQLTYGELNARANRFARYLAERGVEPGGIVAVCMEWSTELVVTFLGVLKAGCAYLPFDPDYPKQRIVRVLQNARPALLVNGGSATAILADSGVPQAALPSESETETLSTANIECSATNGASMAYVMYTSGSTGAPKGVCVTHRAILRLVLNTNYIAIDAADRVAQTCNMAFDVSTFELWGALLNGACLVGIPRDVILSPGDLKTFIRRERIDVLWLTAGLFNRIASQEPGAFETVRTMLCGGEALTPKWVRRVLEAGAPGRFINGYGPTECTTFATWHHVREVSEDAASIPIGQPIANTTAYVLGNHRRLLPIGIPGELYLGGDGLAMGYLGDPELTDHRFVPNPFAPGEKLYRTGDLVKRNPNGAIDFIGRMDGQIKLRGFRIELGEIEYALAQTPGVKDVAVVVHETAPDTKELVAYLTINDGRSLDPDGIRSELAKRLPEYMVPSLYVQLEGLPLNASGKVDKRSLPEPNRDRIEYGGAYVEPATETEAALATAWSELLHRPEVGRNDNFFDIGGNSLLAIQLLDPIERAFGIRLPLREIFEYPSLAAQARRLDVVRSASGVQDTQFGAMPGDGKYLIPVRAEGSRRPIYFVAGAGDVAGTYTGLVGLLDSEQPFYVVPDPLFTSFDPSEFTVERLAKLYLGEIRARQPKGPYHLGGYSFGAIVAFEIAQQLTTAGETVATLAIVDTSPHLRGGSAPSRKLKQFRARSRYIAQKAALCFRWRRSIYADAALIGKVSLRRLWNTSERVGDEPTIWEYVVWALRDISNQDRMGKAREQSNGGVGERLEMLQEPHIRKLNQSMTLAMRAYNDYRFKEYSGRITLFRAEGSPTYCDRDDETLGWGALAAEGVEVRFIPGAHNTLFNRPQVEVLARELQASLSTIEIA
jgi:amino acid adenylation domain-containing protein